MSGPQTIIAQAAFALVWFLPVLPAHAAPTADPPVITTNPSSIGFKAPIKLPRTRTVALAPLGTPLEKLSFIASDLVSPTGDVILSSAVQIEPTELPELKGEETISVTLPGAERLGTYEGAIRVLSDGKPLVPPVTIPLILDVSAIPQVRADVPMVKLAAKPGFLSPSDGIAARHAFHLQQNGPGSAHIEAINMLALAAADGSVLPPDTLAVSGGAGVDITTAEPTRVDVKLLTSGLDPGKYTGTISVAVRDAQASLDIPAEITAKASPWWALLVLAAGIAAGVMLGWWKAEGKRTREMMKKVKQLWQEVAAGGRLQADDRDGVRRLLEDCVRKLEDDSTYDAALADFESASKRVEEARRKTEEQLDSLAALRDRLAGVSAAEKLAAELTTTLAKTKSDLIDGEFGTAAHAGNRIDELKGTLTQLEQVIEAFNALTEEERTARRDSLASADSVSKAEQIAKLGGRAGAPSPRGVSFAPQTIDMHKGQLDKLQLSWKRSWQLTLGSTLATGFAYLFSLAVGYSTLYASVATFGASLDDYIGLFLWGTVAESIRGSAVTLSDLKLQTSQK